MHVLHVKHTAVEQPSCITRDIVKIAGVNGPVIATSIDTQFSQATRNSELLISRGHFCTRKQVTWKKFGCERDTNPSFYA